MEKTETAFVAKHSIKWILEVISKGASSSNNGYSM